MQIPFIDVRAVNARDEHEFQRAFTRVLRSGQYILGAETREFERLFADWVGARHAIAVANGLDALRLVLRSWISLGVLNPSSEFIVPANSFIASALAITDAGLKCSFADVSEATFNLTARTVRASLRPETAGVMVVHLYGQLADIDAISALCAAENLLLIEDAAQAHGAQIGGRRAGAFGKAAGFSFYPSKNLGGLGDGGCVVTDDEVLATRLRAFANYGGTRKYVHDFCGFNSRMSEIQAALLTIKLKRIDEDNASRRRVALSYLRAIHNPFVELPVSPENAEAHVWHLFVVRTIDRNGLARYLAERGVETMIHYPITIPRQRAYVDAHGLVFAMADRLQHEVLSLPISPVMNDDAIGHVIDAVNGWPGPAARNVLASGGKS